MAAPNLLERLEVFCRELGGSAERSGDRLTCRFGARKRVRVAAGWLLGGYRGFTLNVEGKQWGFVRRYGVWKFKLHAPSSVLELGLGSSTIVEGEAQGFEASISTDSEGKRVFEFKLL